jgi:hypothetical protein
MSEPIEQKIVTKFFCPENLWYIICLHASSWTNLERGGLLEFIVKLFEVPNKL